MILPLVSHALALQQNPSPTVAYLGLVIILAHSAIGAWHGLVAAVLDVLVLWASGSVRGQFPALLFVYALVVVLQFISHQGLLTLLEWSWNSQKRANDLLAQLRQSRGQLNRALDALTEASRRLQRSNRELLIARQEADEARALREQFVVNISHELRTPLNLIVGFVEMMYLSPESYPGAVWSPDLVADIGRTYRAAQHLESLISDILDLSRIDAARMPMVRELASLRSVIDEASDTIMPLLEQHHLGYKVIYDAGLPNLLIDRTRIRQVMLNLLNNAIRFTDQGGITVRVKLLADRVQVSVQDTGVGIPAEQLPHIFDKFSQAHVGGRSRGGAGLGLALSREFVRLHGGSMWVESTEGQGSCFYFCLPLPGMRLGQEQDLVSVPPRPMSPEEGPLVVVDQDPDVSEMLSRYVGERRVCPVNCIAELDSVIDAEHPSAVLVNTMPDAPPEEWLGGLTPATAQYNVPVIRCSIPSASWLRHSSGMQECLTKPVSRDRLYATVERWCPQGGTVLIVDDDPGFVSLMVRMLEGSRSGYRLRTAYSGEQALAMCEEAMPDLVLLDLLMPGMDGLAVLSELGSRGLLTRVSVVGITASSYGEDLLQRRGEHYTISQSGGLSAHALADLLSATVDTLKPDYTRSLSTR